MIIGEHARGSDLDVNPLKSKQLTNVRASGKDENVLLTPPIKMRRRKWRKPRTSPHVIQILCDGAL